MHVYYYKSVKMFLINIKHIYILNVIKYFCFEEVGLKL